MAIKPEQQFQLQVADFSRAHRLRMIHVPNEGKRTDYTGNLLKRMGMYPGFSDCFFPKGNKSFKGLFVELKVKPNKPTQHQLNFIEEMIQEGYAGHIAYSIDEAINIITLFYSL